MIAWLFSDGQIERLFWARPVATPVMIAAFVSVVLLTAFLYRRRQGLLRGRPATFVASAPHVSKVCTCSPR